MLSVVFPAQDVESRANRDRSGAPALWPRSTVERIRARERLVVSAEDRVGEGGPGGRIALTAYDGRVLRARARGVAVDGNRRVAGLVRAPSDDRALRCFDAVPSTASVTCA